MHTMTRVHKKAENAETEEIGEKRLKGGRSLFLFVFLSPRVNLFTKLSFFGGGRVEGGEPKP